MLLVLGLAAAVAFAIVAQRFALPYPIVFVLAGTALTFVPGLPPVTIAPDWIPIARAKTDEAAAPSRVANKVHAADAASSQADVMGAQVRMAPGIARHAHRRAGRRLGLRPQCRGGTIADTGSGGCHDLAGTPHLRHGQLQGDADQPHRPRNAGDLSVDACGGAKVRGTVIGFAPVAQNALSTLPTLSAPTNFVKVTQRVPIRIAAAQRRLVCVSPGYSHRNIGDRRLRRIRRASTSENGEALFAVRAPARA
ncbi:MAG: hypothetical protein M3154_00925 [Candidatus Eremiobacteraeota bacterium]|nr:hypothetical protein [Candidatus Eremiobacteraeota bacterium]